MNQVRMTLEHDPAALPRVLALLARKQCVVKYVHAQCEGPTFHVQVHFESAAVPGAHVTHLLRRLHSVSALTVDSAAVMSHADTVGDSQNTERDH